MKTNKRIEISTDWGCEHTEQDAENYAAFVARALPGVEVGVNDNVARDRLFGFDDESAARRELQEIWTAWCDAGWPA